MQRACIFALGCLLLSGCATLGRKPAPSGAIGAIMPSPTQVVGRVIAVDTVHSTVIIEVGAHVVLPSDWSTRILIARTDSLLPTARLQSSAYLRGRILGATLLEGQPAVGDEVVCKAVVP